MIDLISMQTENPWREFEMLVDYSNLILNNEKDIIRKFNESLGDTESLNFKEYSIHEDIVPAPFMGDVYNSPIVLLTLNPGWDPKNGKEFWVRGNHGNRQLTDNEELANYCIDKWGK